jgi:hypothetical protein
MLDSFLANKAQHGACPEMVTPELVHRIGPVDTIAVHVDLDGLYAGAKWVLGGYEPYDGADADARAIDTRRGKPGPIAERIDRALRARFRDETLKHPHLAVFDCADPRTPPLSKRSTPRPGWSIPCSNRPSAWQSSTAWTARWPTWRSSPARPTTRPSFCLLGQQRAAVAVVRDSGSLSIAADFESGLDFVKLLDLGGGMPTRVSVPEARREEVMAKLARTTAHLARTSHHD